MSLVHRWTLSRLCTRIFRPELRTAGGLLQWLHPTQVPVPISTLLCLGAMVSGPGVFPKLVGLLLLVRVLRRWGCGRSRFVGLAVHGCLLGRLPGASLLLLAV